MTLCVGAMGLLAACGSVDEDKEPVGSGGAGSGGSDGLDAKQACMNFCNARNASGCEPQESDCEDFCDDRIEDAGGLCEDKAAVLFTCALPYASTCPRDVPPSCVEQMVALETCMETHGCAGGALCAGGGGEDGATTCSCEATCLGKRHEMRCDTPAGGMTTCVCLVNSVEVGTCQEALPDPCGVKKGCCQEFFNIP
ncbi:hypothetical protein BE20_41265 [Sorangium cellulosum]|uniref:Uncharacterized protein n=1 Tax=Sorangium cellulosum TaxID=56 RepID=A0A150SP74_SORCE|nr:hypothetical protein BE18_36835 [Sorangium cellulosum]KYF96694.1 hypothetical protein BE20_41265 [Sorangium cellulosum]